MKLNCKGNIVVGDSSITGCIVSYKKTSVVVIYQSFAKTILPFQYYYWNLDDDGDDHDDNNDDNDDFFHCDRYLII